MAVALAPVLVVGGTGSGSGAAGRTLPTQAGTAAASAAPPDRQYVVKFREGLRVRVRSGRLVMGDRPDGEGPVRQATEVSRAQSVLEAQSVLDGIGAVRAKPLFSLPERYLDDLEARLERSTGQAFANHNSYAVFGVAAQRDVDAVLRLVRNLPAVESVEVMPGPSPLPSPSFVAFQGFLRPTVEGGIGLDATGDVAGGRGANVRIIDLEYSWNGLHEDLDRAGAPGALIPMGIVLDPFHEPGNPTRSTDHGTAVLGLLAADDDPQGVTGLAPDSDLRMVNTNSTDGYFPANAIALAHAHLTAGDVMLIEQQASGPNGCGGDQLGCVPLEWYASVYDAVRAATADGIIVVEAGGNGSQDLDNAPYVQPFPAGRPDSGAIIVGAGSVEDCSGVGRSRMWFSNHGARVDLQGWGECVTTTGYGGLYNGGDNARYTGSFSGTSSAAAMVAGVAAIVSSVAQQQQVPLTPIALRTLLAETGRPGPLGARIGSEPDIDAALRRFVPNAVLSAPSIAAPRAPVVLSASGSSDPQGGALQFAWSLDGDGVFDDGTAAVVTALAPPTTRSWHVQVRVTDPHGASRVASAVIPVEFRRDTAPGAGDLPGAPPPRPTAPAAPPVTTGPRTAAPVAG